jgi:hypothetical protein
MLLFASPLALLLSRTVRQHYVAVAAVLAGSVAGSLGTVVTFRRRLWNLDDPGVAPPLSRLAGVYSASTLVVVVVLLVGTGSSRQPARITLDDRTPGPTTPPVTPSQTGTPSVTVTPSATPTTAVPAPQRTTFVPPDVLGSIGITKADVARVAGSAYDEAGRGQQLYDPQDFELCQGVPIETPTVIDSHPQRFESSGQNFYHRYYASEPVLYDSVEGAAALMRGIRANAKACGYVIRPGTNLAQETVRVAQTLDDGAYWDIVFLRTRNVFVQIAATSNDGDHTTVIEDLAGGCARVLRRVVDAQA